MELGDFRGPVCFGNIPKSWDLSLFDKRAYLFAVELRVEDWRYATMNAWNGYIVNFFGIE